MAKKATPGSTANHGFNDIIGIVLMGSAILLLIALLSYHPRDVSANGLPVNASLHNWIGPFGAWIAWFWLFCVGGAAYIVPFLLLLTGLACFFRVSPICADAGPGPWFSSPAASGFSTCITTCSAASVGR